MWLPGVSWTPIRAARPDRYQALDRQAVHRRDRFPKDLMFRLTADEVEELNRPQFVTGCLKHRDLQHTPRALAQDSSAHALKRVRQRVQGGRRHHPQTDGLASFTPPCTRWAPLLMERRADLLRQPRNRAEIPASTRLPARVWTSQILPPQPNYSMKSMSSKGGRFFQASPSKFIAYL